MDQTGGKYGIKTHTGNLILILPSPGQDDNWAHTWRASMDRDFVRGSFSCIKWKENPYLQWKCLGGKFYFPPKMVTLLQQYGNPKEIPRRGNANGDIQLKPT